MNASEFLGRVKIASPCHARWQDMTGDDRSRYCPKCQKRVYNFSAMSAEEVADLIRAKEGKLCGRFYRRRDGTMLTANCPVGAERYFLRVKALVATAATLLLTSLGVRAWSSGDVPADKGPFAQRCDNALWTVKGWFGLNPRPAATMGMVCIRPSPTPRPAPQVAGSSSDIDTTKP
jgi:hypothetical protein